MAWNDLLANQMVSFTDAQGSGFDLKSGQSAVTSDKIMTKSDILTKYDIASDNFDTYANNQLVPKNSWNTDIIIGTQTWKAQNLNVETYRDGTLIPQSTTDADWLANGNAGIGAWCWYANLSSNGTVYGRLYNWYAVAGLDGSGTPRNLAPIGYHIPTDAEWTTLTDSLGGETVAGGKMKSTGTSFWTIPNQDATNESGFTGLPGGFRNFNGPFSDTTFIGYWWSSTPYSTSDAWFRSLNSSEGSINKNYTTQPVGFSVRLIKD
jgi:uncharacterized protein (TIGR02145 family)